MSEGEQGPKLGWIDKSGDMAMSEGEEGPKTGENVRTDFSMQRLWRLD